jgi:hypothetical protein
MNRFGREALRPAAAKKNPAGIRTAAAQIPLRARNPRSPSMRPSSRAGELPKPLISAEVRE